MLDMTAAEVGAFLDEQETGVLSLSDGDGHAYGPPESFGYRNGRLYFLLELPSESQKRAYLDSTETVSFTVHEATSSRDFASVIVRGSLSRLADDGAEADLAVGANEQFPSRYVFAGQGESAAEEYVLDADEISGRKGPGFEIGTGGMDRPVVGEE